MAIDMRRVALAAADAALQSALEDSRQAKRANRSTGKKRRLSPARAVLIGAGATTLARLAIGSRAREMLEDLDQRLTGAEDREE